MAVNSHVNRGHETLKKGMQALAMPTINSLR